MKTSESIEQGEERKRQTKEATPLTSTEIRKYARDKHPNSHTPRGCYKFGPGRNPNIKPTQWKPGQSGNPLGSPLLRKDKHDVAREIARAVFENNREQLYQAFANAALKGNAYAFQQLADRAYGKLKERVEYEVSEYREMSDEALIERLHQLEAQLGIVRDNR
jgi:hypothetical protein